MSTKRIKKRRENLLRRDPHCYFCGKEVVYFYMKGRPGRLPHNFATADHINTRLVHPDGRPRQGQIVLSCWQCNNDRNRAETATIPIEELQRRSGQYTVEAYRKRLYWAIWRLARDRVMETAS